jgi:Relaxase/Mobilisation nuclease domain
MIIKGQSRGRSRQLAAHLLRQDQNERIRLYEVRGTVASDVEGALAEMEARGAAAASKRPLYHASVSPEAHTPLTDAQIRIAVDTLEEALGLGTQPRIVVVHRKENREHVHVVWSRVDADQNRAIPDSWNYRCHEEVARTLETLFGHRPIPRSGSRKQEPARQARAPRNYELRQEERTGKPTAQTTAEITALWRSSSDAGSFQVRLEEAGYRLARGDRRVLVVIDRNGEVHSLARRIDGVNTRDLRSSFRNVDLQMLPSVAEVRQEPRKESPATRLRRDFVAVARELAQPQTPALPAAPFVQAMRKPNSAARLRLPSATSGAEGGVSGKRLHVRSRGHVAPRSTRYRVLWAVIIAEFAAKIANAYRHIASHELEAALAALQAEREAALSTLAQQQSGEARERRKAPWVRKGRASRPRYIRRLRIKRWWFKE